MQRENPIHRYTARTILRLEQLETRAVPALLFLNGNWITGIGNGFGGANTSTVEPDFTSYGFTATASNPSYHVADDFTVPTGILGWNLAKAKVYAYQRFAPANLNTFEKLHLRIHDGDPSGTGVVVLDCSGANAIDVTGAQTFTNTYRVSETAPLNNERAVKELSANLCAPKRLIPGTYWLEWWAEGSVLYNPPQANVTVPWDSQDNGKQFEVAVSTWESMLDPGTDNIQDIPFEIHGRAIPTGIPPAPDREPRESRLLVEQTTPSGIGPAIRRSSDTNPSSDDSSKPSSAKAPTVTPVTASQPADELFIVLHADGVV